MGELNFDINAYMRLNPWDMIMVCVSTLLIVLIAKHFFWDKVVTYLDTRAAAIQANIDLGAKERATGETYKSEYEQQLAGAKSEARTILENAKANAQHEKREIIQGAQSQAETMKEKARKDIEREKVQAREEMKNAIVDVAFDAAKQIVGKEMDAQAHKQYVDDFIEHAGDSTWQA